MELLAGPAAPKWLISSNEVTFARSRTLTDAQDYRNGPRCENGSATRAWKKRREQEEESHKSGRVVKIL